MVGPKSVTSRGKKSVCDDRPAVVGRVLLHPLRGDLAVVVVGRDRVDLLAPLLHDVGHELLDGLSRRGARAEDVAVADAALVERVVEVERVEALEDRPDRLPRGGGDAAVDDGRLVLGGGLGRELRVELDVGLRVVVDELDLLAEQPAARVDLLHRVVEAVDHRPPVDVEAARGVVDAHHLDRFLGREILDEPRARAGGDGPGGGELQEVTTFERHAHAPPRIGNCAVRRNGHATAEGCFPKKRTRLLPPYCSSARQDRTRGRRVMDAS